MNTIDLQMKLLEGKPIGLFPNLNIHKVSFSHQNDIGYIKYNQIISILCITKDAISKQYDDSNLDPYKFIVNSALNSLNEKENAEQEIDDTYLVDDLIDVLECIFDDTVVLDKEYACFVVGDSGILYYDNFEEFQSIVRKRCCLENIEKDIDNPDTERTRLLLEKRKKLREKVHKSKDDSDEDGLTIIDLISIFAESEHMKLEDVFQYDVYQFNDQFNRMKIFKDYEVNIQALLAGAKSEEVNIQHWLGKIKK